MRKRNTYDWPRLIRLGRRRPGRWWLALPDVPARTVSSIQLKRHPNLRVPDGRLEPLLRNEYTTPDGQQRGDVWLRFIPNPPPVDSTPDAT